MKAAATETGWLCAALAGLWLTAGVSPIPARGQVNVVDSAGVRLVTSHQPLWGGETRWRVGAEPRVDVGVVEGDSVYQFRSIVAAILDAHRRLTVVSGDAPLVRQYDAQGKHLRSTGRNGPGPGEFRAPLRLVPDTSGHLLVWDPTQRRITWLTPELEVARTERLAGPRATHVGALLPDGSRVMPASFQSGTPTRRGPWRPTGVLALFSPDDADGDTLMTYRGPEMMGHADGTAGPFAFPRETVVRAGGSPPRVVVGDTETFDIAVFTADGALAMRVRRATPLRGVTRDDIDRFRRALMSQIEGAPNEQYWRRQYADLEGPSTFPAFADLHVDRAGYLWVQEYEPFAPEQRSFAVFDPDGRWLGRVSMPDGLNVLDIGEDYIVGSVRDSLDVPSVHVYDLVR